ncbi:FadR family transcriptional regulator [Bosea caraganae]|uniref:FadR family transcriptional regulator n=1 Tax=Bosea caraganae TaxID=2763117 RepID=A0A370L4F0_9HYPH|nr:FadR/GntR family transcriptional regulator [Bosea caraganae]RDJ22308.1 FadR family transcriptional regulator [Bosea caraganae]RDJ23758.1 FadR family transcriptional regulator [Bosea caraganae]
MPLEAVESPRLYRQIADQLRQLIDRREFPVGGRLPPERELAEKLGVSRPSVREALIALEVEGRVRIRMGSGVYVTEAPRRKPAEPADLAEGPFELLKAREVVESAVCAEAGSQATPQNIAKLDDILTQMEAPGLSGDELIAFDRAFHVAIAGMLGNAVLARFVGDLFDQRVNPYFQQLASYFENDVSWREAFGEHRAVRDAIASGSADKARDAMRWHLKQSQERFSQSFGDGRAASGQESVDACPPGKN